MSQITFFGIINEKAGKISPASSLSTVPFCFIFAKTKAKGSVSKAAQADRQLNKCSASLQSKHTLHPLSLSCFLSFGTSDASAQATLRFRLYPLLKGCASKAKIEMHAA